MASVEVFMCKPINRKSIDSSSVEGSNCHIEWTIPTLGRPHLHTSRRLAADRGWSRLKSVSRKRRHPQPTTKCSGASDDWHFLNKLAIAIASLDAQSDGRETHCLLLPGGMLHRPSRRKWTSTPHWGRRLYEELSRACWRTPCRVASHQRPFDAQGPLHKDLPKPEIAFNVHQLTANETKKRLAFNYRTTSLNHHKLTPFLVTTSRAHKSSLLLSWTRTSWLP